MTNNTNTFKTGQRVKFKAETPNQIIRMTDKDEFWITKTEHGLVSDDNSLAWIPEKYLELASPLPMQFDHQPTEAGIITLAYYFDEFKLHMGFSLCRPQDNFSRQEGRHRAIQRLEREPVTYTLTELQEYFFVGGPITPDAYYDLRFKDFTFEAISSMLTEYVELYICL